MKRVTLFVLLLLVAAASAQASYKIVLTDGTFIVADEKPAIKADLAYFSKEGLFLYIPVARIDLAKTDEVNMVRQIKSAPIIDQTMVAPPTESVKPVFVDDSMLDLIRKRSRLANEGQFERPGLTESKSGAIPAEAGAPGQPDANKKKADLQTRLDELLSQRGALQGQVDGMQTRLNDLQDRYNFSTQQNDRQSIQSQIDQLNSQLSGTRSRLAAVNNDALSIQQELARQPVTVEVKP